MTSTSRKVALATLTGAVALGTVLGTAGAASAGTLHQVPDGQVIRIHTDAVDKTVMGTLTVTQPLAAGHARAYECGELKPNSSVINFAAGQTVASYVTVHTDEKGDFCVYTSADAHFVFDQTATVDDDVLKAERPERRLDTREGEHAHKSVGGTVTRVTTPNTNSTVFGTLTVTNPETSGWALAYPCDAPKRPLASTVNFTAGQTIANFIGVRTDAAGEFCIFSPATANFVFDQVAATDFVKAELPERLFDSRDDSDHAEDKVLAGEVIEVQTDDPDSMVFGTLTVTGGEAQGWATAYPCSKPRPWASSINFPANTSVAAFIGVATDNTGKFCVYTNTKASIVFDRVAATDLIKGGEPFRRLDSRDRWEDEQEHEHTQEDESTDDSASASPSASASAAS
ncbi:MAG: hypothetical protein E6Q90_09005 [Actinobacteria bacterium]|nr:MAG: hypothetical protein E6Q90_09005 [Actinomycetota bacterium]